MIGEFVNRMGMFDTSLGVLKQPPRKVVWLNQPPLIFGTKVAEATTAVEGLRVLCAQHGVNITGSAQAKDASRTLAASATDILENALWAWFTDRGDLVNAAKAERSPSEWLRMRDGTFADASRWVTDTAAAIIAGPDATAAAAYGVTPARLQAATDQIDNYVTLVTAPQQDQATRKAITLALRAEFAKVEAYFLFLDKLIIQFDGTPAGQSLIAIYNAARNIRNLGSSPTPPSPPPPSTP